MTQVMIKFYRHSLTFKQDVDAVKKVFSEYGATKVNDYLLGNDKAFVFNADETTRDRIKQHCQECRYSYSISGVVEMRVENNDKTVDSVYL